MGFRTQDVRTDVGAGTMDTFLCYVIAKKGWGRTEISNDIRDQIFHRTNNGKLASDLRDGMMSRIDARYNIQKMVTDFKDTYDAVKGFELSPTTIGKIAYNTMGALATMAFDASDAGMDRNRYYFPGDDYWDYLIYTYVTAGRVQPRHTGIV